MTETEARIPEEELTLADTEVLNKAQSLQGTCRN